MFVFQAIQALKLYQTTATRKALTDILENEQCFYKVRIEASLCLAKVRLILILLLFICPLWKMIFSALLCKGIQYLTLSAQLLISTKGYRRDQFQIHLCMSSGCSTSTIFLRKSGTWSVDFFILTLIPAIFLSWNCCLLFMSAACIQVHFKLDSILEGNTINPDQTAPKGAVWSGSMLFAI